MYKLVNYAGQLCCIEKQENDIKIHIPFDTDNTDYQEYLKWLADGNQPLPADN